MVIIDLKKKEACAVFFTVYFLTRHGVALLKEAGAVTLVTM